MATPAKKKSTTAKPATKANAAPTKKPAATKPAPAKKPAAAKTASKKPAAQKPVAASDRYRMICEQAYFIAEQDGFQPGQDLRYWLQAERAIIALLGH